MRLNLFFLIFLLFAINSYAQISVPDYSFTGKEITGFTVQPSYTSVNFDFKPSNKMDVYIQERKSEFTSLDNKNYSSDEPGFMYSGSAGTSISSIFVGDIAYRNNIVKMFIQKQYFEVIKSFKKYEEKLKNSEYTDETQLLYGISLYETADRISSYDILSVLSLKGGEFGEIAQDYLFGKLSSLKQWNKLEETARSVESFTPYGLSVWLTYLYKKDKYRDIINVLDKNKDFENEYSDFKALRLWALYYLNDYKGASELEPYMRGSSNYPLAIDALIMSGNPAKALDIIKNLPDSDKKNILNAKANIALGEFDTASSFIKAVEDDKERLALLFYTAGNKFEEAPASFFSSFSFYDKQDNDYINYYLGLKYLSEKTYDKALNSFSLVAFNKDMIISSYFFRGMAAIKLDQSRAEWYFMRYIGSGNDESRIMLSKFMIAQIYLKKQKYDESLMLIDNCSTDYCRKLKSDIYLLRGSYEESIAAVSGLDDDRSILVRANNLYNMTKYKGALEELSKIKNKTGDSEYLMMMSLFKSKQYKEAINVLENNKDNNRILSDGVEQLILAGYNKKALQYIEIVKNMPLDYKIEYAKLLQAEGQIDKAEGIYKELINSKIKIYESMQGLYQIAIMKGKMEKFISDSADYLEKNGNFEKNDLFASQFAAYAMDLRKPNLAIRYVNYFMENFPKSPYLPDVYRTRSQLYKFTGRYENCIEDAENIIKSGGDSLDANFIKAECTENIDKKRAVELYRTMAADKGRFYQPASGRLIILSDDPDEVLSSSMRMQQASPDVYKNGIIRFLEISDESAFMRHSESIKKLASEGNGEVRSAALWRTGKHFYDKKMYKEAARQYLKGYYLFPDTPYAVKNLESAKSAYEALQLKTRANKVNQMITAFFGKNTKKSKK